MWYRTGITLTSAPKKVIAANIFNEPYFARDKNAITAVKIDPLRAVQLPSQFKGFIVKSNNVISETDYWVVIERNNRFAVGIVPHLTGSSPVLVSIPK